MEIERKFLLNDFPDGQEGVRLIKTATVYQGYLSCGTPTVRIRSTECGGTTTYMLNCKGKGTLARQEVEIALEKEEFDQLSSLLPIPPVKKEYRVYRLPGGEELECSWVDRGTAKQFCYAEVEFSSVEQANAFLPPAFLGRDVTEEPYYAMSSYWRRKILPEIGTRKQSPKEGK